MLGMHRNLFCLWASKPLSRLGPQRPLIYSLISQRNSYSTASPRRRVSSKSVVSKETLLNPSNDKVPEISTDESGNSSIADRLKWKSVEKFRLSFYTDLSKSKLTCFVLLTTMAGYALAPGEVSILTLGLTTLGTAGCVAAANTYNQWIESYYDAQMNRTRNRVLVRHAISPAHAFMFATASGLAGTFVLYHVSPIAALLGASNIFLYSCVYTPMKRSSIYNTWPGAVVGAIPPIIGWTASTGAVDMGAVLLALSLYAWQFPHFNSLSWNLRADYSKAGYRMMSVIDPSLNARVSLRYAIALFPISAAFCYYGVTSWLFFATSSIINSYMAAMALLFWKHSDNQRARSLFFSSLVHLPVFLVLLMAHKLDKEQESKEKKLE